MSRSHRFRLLSLVVVSGVVLAACSQPSNDPTEFGDQTRQNFESTCTANWEGSGTTLASLSVCSCAYDIVVDYYSSDGRSFDDFEEMSRQLRTDPDAMPDDLERRMAEECPGWGSGDAGQALGPRSTDGSGTVVDATAGA